MHALKVDLTDRPVYPDGKGVHLYIVVYTAVFYACLPTGNANFLLIYSHDIIHLTLFLSTLLSSNSLLFLGSKVVYSVLNEPLINSLPNI
jgi:hypothetical protein